MASLSFIMVFEDITPGHPAVQRIARMAGVDPYHAFGALVAFWQWADELTDDGFISDVTPGSVDYQVRLPRFAEALSTYRSKNGGEPWLAFNEDGLRIHNYNARGGTSTKKREKDNARKAEARAKEGADEATPEPVRETPDKLRTNGGRKRPPSLEDGDRYKYPPPPPLKKPRRVSRSSKAAAEAEAVKALGPEWGEALAAVQRAGPKAAAGAVLAASKLGQTPQGVLDLVAVFQRHRGLFDSPSGALVDRLTTVGPEVPVDCGWIKDLPRSPVSKARDPTPEEQRQAFVADLKRQGVKGDELRARIDEWDARQRGPVGLAG